MTVENAIRILRLYALGSYHSRAEVEQAINVLDNADLFVGHDGES